MYTNKMRYTGTSGIDTQSMIEAMMKAESAKLYKVQKNAQLIQWRQDAYRNTSSSLTTFQNDFLSLTGKLKMRSSSAFVSSKSSVKLNGVDSNAATVKSSVNAQVGEYSLKIQQLAQAELRKGEAVDASITTGNVDVDNLKAGDTLVFNLDGASKTITISQDLIDEIGSGNTNGDKVELLAKGLGKELEKAFGTEGTDAQKVPKISVEANGDKLTFNTTKGHSLKITEGSGRNTAITAGTAFETINSSNPTDDTVSFTVEKSDGSSISIDIDLKIEGDKEITGANFVSKINAALSKEKVTDVRASLDKDGKVVFTNTGSGNDTKIKATDKDGNPSKFLELAGFGNDTEIDVKHTTVLTDFKLTSGITTGDTRSSLADMLGVTGGLDFDINGVKFSFDSTDSIKTVLDKVNASGANVKFSFDNISRTFSLEGKTQGASATIDIKDNGTAGTDSFFDTFKISETLGANDKQAQDALFTFNGIETSRTTNSFEINGISMQLNEVTGNDELKISVIKDSTTAVSNIKEFVEGYNKLIEAMNKELRTTRTRTKSGITYQPLTDEEKVGMSESQIKTWEEKAKEGLLYNDSIVRDITSSMRSYLQQGVDIGGGKKLSLYDIGITTSPNYSDGGKLVIDESKLAKAIDDYGDDIATLFTKDSEIPYSDKKNASKRMEELGLAERINDIIENATSTNGTIAQKAGIKNGVSEKTNQLSKQLKVEQDRISALKVYLVNKENYYYTMFSKMEASITNSNNQMSYLQAQLGVGQ